MSDPAGRPKPDLPTVISLGLLAVVALLLLMPLLGLGRPPVWVLAGLLLVRLGLQFWRTRRPGNPSGGRSPSRAGGWVLDLMLIGLLLWAGQGPQTGH